MNSTPQNPNALLLVVAAQKLAPLLDRIAFVGGAATGLLITDPGAAPVRPTLDIDAIVELASYADLIRLEEQLRELGFRPAQTPGAPICRWIHQDTVVDLMPTDSAILGFGNRWYRPALQNAEIISLGDYKIRLIPAHYFLATKLEAFYGRGGDDYRASRDIEDIVTVIDGRAEIAAEVQQCNHDLRQYLGNEFSRLLHLRDFMESLSGHLLPDPASQQRLTIVLARMRQIAGST